MKQIKQQVCERAGEYETNQYTDVETYSGASGREVIEQIWRQVKEQVGEKVEWQVWEQMGEQVWRQVERRVREHIRRQAREQIEDQEEEKGSEFITFVGKEC